MKSRVYLKQFEHYNVYYICKCYKNVLYIRYIRVTAIFCNYLWIFGFQLTMSFMIAAVMQQNALYATEIEIRSMIFVQNVFHRVTDQVSVLIRSLRPHGSHFFCSRLPLYTSPRPCCIARSLRRSDFNVITGVPPPVTGRYTVPSSREPLFPYNTITSSCDHTLYWPR
jgi:hypothetical protein